MRYGAERFDTLESNNIRRDLKIKTISGVFWKGMERICAQFVSTVVSVVLARLLLPDDYSVVGIVAIFFSFCNLFISAGLNTALIQKKNSDLLDFYTVLSTSLFMATVLYVLMFCCAPFISRLYHKTILIPAIRVMGVSFFIDAYKSVVSAKVTADLQFRKFFWSTIIGTVISAIIGIILALQGFGPWALIAQQMTNSLIDALVLTITSHFQPQLTFSLERFKTLFAFGGRIFGASIIHTVYLQVRPLVVGIKYTTTDLAFYTKANGFPDLITSVASNTLSSSLFPVMAKVQDDKEMILGMTRRFMQLASYLVFPLMIGFAAISESFVKIVLTDKWLPIVPYVIIFCFSGMLSPIQDGNLQAIRAIGRSDMILKLEIIKKSSYFFVIVLFVLFSRNPLVLAFSNIITALLATLINTQPNKKLIGYSLKYQLMDILPNFLITIVMGLVVFGMKLLPLKTAPLMLLQLLVGILVYSGLSIITRNQSFFYLMNTIKGLINYVKNKRLC